MCAVLERERVRARIGGVAQRGRRLEANLVVAHVVALVRHFARHEHPSLERGEVSRAREESDAVPIIGIGGAEENGLSGFFKLLELVIALSLEENITYGKCLINNQNLWINIDSYSKCKSDKHTR